jgi:DNA-binding transcriptional regulator YdaS (Cro superfamily)
MAVCPWLNVGYNNFAGKPVDIFRPYRNSGGMSILHTPDDIIDALGGTGAVARRLKLADSTVSTWRRRRIPASYFVAINRCLGQLTPLKIAGPSAFDFVDAEPEQVAS